MPNNETMNLLKQYKSSKDIEIRNKIILGNMGLIYTLSHKYRLLPSHQSFDDFVSEGVIGIIEAIDKFDLDRRNNFSTYAHWWILKKINDCVSMGTMGSSQHRIGIFRAYEREKISSQNIGDEKSIESIANTIGVNKKILTEIVNQKDDISLDGPVNFSNKIRGNSFEDSLIDAIDFEKTKNIIRDSLSDREKDILNYRFGLNEHEELTLKETSKKLNVTAERVRQIQNTSLKKIRTISKRRPLNQ